MQTLANVMALLFVAHFFWSYFRNCYRKGYSMDVWHFLLLMNLVVIHVMLPFSRSDLNIFALGPVLLVRAQAHVNEAYLISALGYAGILIGGSLWRVRLGWGLRKSFAGGLELISRAALVLLNSRGLLVVHGLIAMGLMTAVLAYYFKVDGFGFNLSGLLLVVPALRPIAQFTAFYSVLVASYALARFYEYRERSMLLIVLGIVTGLLFFGARGNFAAVAFMTVFVLFLKRGRRLSLIGLGSGILAALSLVLLLDALRRPGFSLLAVAGGSMIGLLYGNSFSDTRDFALILSFWDGHYFLGRTYLAGLIAFVPRFLSSFRDTWSIGVVTASMAGFKSTEHPGLRVGLFGEAYLNFGLPAVVLLGLFVGAAIRLIDLRMKQSLALPNQGMRVYSMYVITIVISVAESSVGASALYSILLVLLVSWVMLRVARVLQIEVS